MADMPAEFRPDVSAPDVEPAWLWVWRAWWRLHQDRPYRGGGFGPPIPGRIPWRDVVAWCEFNSLSDGAAVFMDACFEHMDSAYFEHHAAKAAAAKSTPGEK